MAPKKPSQPPAAIPANVAAPSHGVSTASSQPVQRKPPPTASTTPATKSSNPVAPSAQLRNANSAQDIIQGVWQNYVDKTPQRVKLIDTFMAFLVVVGALQFVYCVLAGNYPFNAFLAGFSATVGQFVLTASLRMQTNPENKADFESISNERAFADYVFGSLLLHFFCVNFIN